MPLLGAHMSIAGGYHKAVEAAAALAMDTVQIFTHSPSQWAVSPVGGDADRKAAPIPAKDSSSGRVAWQSKPMPQEAASQFVSALRRSGLRQPLSHASYLINLAAADEMLRDRSLEAMILELDRATALEVPYVVVHPGSHTTQSAEQGLARVADAINCIHQRRGTSGAQILLENTAGQGTNLGWQFEQLAAILQQLEHPSSVGVCFDTCHAFAGGYLFTTARQYRAMWDQFDALIGADKLRALHINDSKREAASRVDRHEHIGAGKLGLEPFWRIVRDKRLQHLPMCLETPKDDDGGSERDKRNLGVLRLLSRSRSFRTAAAAISAMGEIPGQ